MTNSNLTFNKILANNSRVSGAHVQSVLILFEEKNFYIGDTCIQLDTLKVLRPFFFNSIIDFNFLSQRHAGLYQCLLANNPNVNNVTNLEWEDLKLEDYDLIICASYYEHEFLEFIHKKYGNRILDDSLTLAVVSVSKSMLRPAEIEGKTIFPEYEELYDFIQENGELSDRPLEIYISDSERNWADSWLGDNGLQADEELFILIDSTSERRKMLDINVYYDLLMFVFNKPRRKVLIFDEANIGKEEFYREWIGDEYADRIIFSKQLGLRKDLCLLSAEKVVLIFGPCTGLLHCASGMYNNFVRYGLPKNKVPLLITYTGKYATEDQNAQFWWGASPLINCLIVRETAGKKEMVILHELNQDETSTNENVLLCEEYTSEMLIDYLKLKISSLLRHISI